MLEAHFAEFSHRHSLLIDEKRHELDIDLELLCCEFVALRWYVRLLLRPNTSPFIDPDNLRPCLNEIFIAQQLLWIAKRWITNFLPAFATTVEEAVEELVACREMLVSFIIINHTFTSALET